LKWGRKKNKIKMEKKQKDESFGKFLGLEKNGELKMGKIIGKKKLKKKRLEKMGNKDYEKKSGKFPGGQGFSEAATPSKKVK